MLFAYGACVYRSAYCRAVQIYGIVLTAEQPKYGLSVGSVINILATPIIYSTSGGSSGNLDENGGNERPSTRKDKNNENDENDER